MRSVRVIGAPTDYGANRRGVDMGPSAIRYAGLEQQLETAGVIPADRGDLVIPRPEEVDPHAREPSVGTARFFRETRQMCTRLRNAVAESLSAGATPLVLGGDHSVAIGSVGGSGDATQIGTVWFDAHSDLNTPSTTPSGNVHGMPLAAALGVGEFADVDWAETPGLDARNVVLVGLRSVDAAERALIEQLPITAFSMSDIDRQGITEVVTEALEIAGDGVDGIHVSLDLDWLDPTEAPGVGTPVRGGVSYREAHTAMELLGDQEVLRSMDIVEVNPTLDRNNETAELATELAASAFGKRVL